MKKPTIKIQGKQVQGFINWLYEKYIFYGDPWVEWWEEYGSKDFAKWAVEKGYNYINEKTH